MTHKLTQQERAAQVYLGGSTAREIGELLGVHERTVRRWLLAQGVPPRRSGPRSWLPGQEIVELREAGAPYQEIAHEVGASKTGVRKRYARETGH